MKNSRTSLNKPFYDWIRQVREADKMIEELEDKLYYYNVKLIGYNSPNFEPRLSSTKPEYKDERYIWLDKINKSLYKISFYNKIIEEYKQFVEQFLSTKEKIVVKKIYKLTNMERLSNGQKYYMLNKISRRYEEYKKTRK